MQLRVASLSVVEDLDVVKYGVGEIQSGAPFLSVQKFYLHVRPDGFLSMALSKQSPIVPNEGISPEERILLVKAHEVNWTPWSA